MPAEAGPGPLVCGVGASAVSAPVSKAGSDDTRGKVSAVSAAWVELLGRYEWAWFATFTFQNAIHPEAADKKFRFWVSEVAASYLGARWRQSKAKRARAPQWVRGLEWQKREVLHYHALVTNLPRNYIEFDCRVSFRLVWNSYRNGGYARIDACDGRAAVYSYLSKYVTKGGEIDVSPHLRAAARRLSLV